MRIAKILGGLIAVLLVIVAGLAVFIATLDANEYRGEIAEQAKLATGRDLTIAGPLSFGISLTPSLVVEDVTLSNAEGFSDQPMLKLKRLEVAVRLLPLISGEIDVRRVVLVDPDILLETDADGHGNWVFQTAGQAADTGTQSSGDSGAREATALPGIGEVSIENGRLVYREGATGVETVARIESLVGKAGSRDEPLDLQLKAVLNDIAISLAGQIGPVHTLLNPAARSHVDLTVEALDLTAMVRGSMSLPNVDAAIEVSGDDLAGLKPLVGDAIPAGQSLKLTAQLSAGPESVKLSGLSLTLGDTDLSGDVAVALGGTRPKVDAALTSRQVNLVALMPKGQASGETSGAAQGGGASDDGRVFPDDPLPLDGLKAADVNAQIEIARLLLPDIELAETAVTIALADGKLKLEPASTTLAGNRIKAALALDASREVPELKLDMLAESFDFGRMLKETGTTELLEGSGELDLKLQGQGKSVRAIMASLNGETDLLMGEGRMRTQAFDVLVGGLSAVMGSLFSKQSEWTVVNCTAGRFKIEKGIATSQVMLFDTEYSTVVGEGNVDLGTERLDLIMTPQSKSATLNLSVPVHVEGTLAAPSFRPDAVSVARRVGGLLGSVVFPPAALLSLGDLGTADSNPCLKLASGEAASGDQAAPGGSKSAIDSATEAPKKAIEDAGKALKKLFGN